MAIVLFDPAHRNSLFPFTKTKAIADLRIGIYTIAERWQLLTGMPVHINTAAYLQEFYGFPNAGDFIWIDASVIPTPDLTDKILGLSNGSCWADETGLIIGKSNMAFDNFNADESLKYFTNIYDHPSIERIVYPWQLMQWNDQMLRFDFKIATANKVSVTPSATNRVFRYSCLN